MYHSNFYFKVKALFFNETTVVHSKVESYYVLWTNAVVSEKNGTFICELIMERFMYLHNTQKQLKITIYDRNKSFFEYYLFYNGVYLKLLGSLL